MAGSSLLLVVAAWAFFYLIGSMALLILPTYSTVLGIDFTQTGYLLGLMAISIGVGSAAAGLISGHHIEPRLVPVGAIGMTIFFLLLGTLTPTYTTTAIFIGGAGAFAGLFVIPLQALIQKLAPSDERGRFIGTANGISFTAIGLGSVVYILAERLLGLQPTESYRLFLVVGVLAAIGSGAILILLRRTIGRRVET